MGTVFLPCIPCIILIGNLWSNQRQGHDEGRTFSRLAVQLNLAAQHTGHEVIHNIHAQARSALP